MLEGMNRALILLCLMIVSSLSSADARRFTLDKSFNATVPLRVGSSSQRVNLRFNVNDSAFLEVRVGRVVQRFQPNPVGTEFPSGGLIWDDFNFDGYNDLGVPEDIGYGGVNTFYIVYTYRPSSRRFTRLNFPGNSKPDLCNPVLQARSKTISSECKSGPMWSAETFGFQGGVPYRSSESSLGILGGFAGEASSVWITTRYDARGRTLSETVTEYDSPQPAIRYLPVTRAYLYTAPNSASRTASYIVRGDAIRILGVRELKDGEWQWIQIAYQSRKLGRIVRWINLG
jgi:hypothetical protein